MTCTGNCMWQWPCLHDANLCTASSKCAKSYASVIRLSSYSVFNWAATSSLHKQAALSYCRVALSTNLWQCYCIHFCSSISCLCWSSTHTHTRSLPAEMLCADCPDSWSVQSLHAPSLCRTSCTCTAWTIVSSPFLLVLFITCNTYITYKVCTVDH